MKSSTTNIRISPKKLNLVAEMIRRKPVMEAENILRFTTKKGSEIIRKALISAVANAENNFKQNKESLMVEEIIVGKGPTLKRFNPVSRGRAHPILKRMSVMTIKVGVLETAPSKLNK
jgi:large subunit ribosomal protein L22